MTMTTMVTRMAALGSLAVLALACGGDDDATPSPQPTPEAAAIVV